MTSVSPAGTGTGTGGTAPPVQSGFLQNQNYFCQLQSPYFIKNSRVAVAGDALAEYGLQGEIRPNLVRVALPVFEVDETCCSRILHGDVLEVINLVYEG